MTIRPLQQLLDETFDQRRSVGWISELISAAGRDAGQVLAQQDTSALRQVIVARDETFFQNWPLLLVIEPVSATILLAKACPDRQADTWGAALLLAQEQGATISGLVEDMARMYPKSQQEAGLDLAGAERPVAHSAGWRAGATRPGTGCLPRPPNNATRPGKTTAQTVG